MKNLKNCMNAVIAKVAYVRTCAMNMKMNILGKKVIEWENLTQLKKQI